MQNKIKKTIILSLLFLVIFFGFFDSVDAQTCAPPCGATFICDYKDATKTTTDCFAFSALKPLTFDPPTETTTFSELICDIVNFISTTILPPIAVLMTLFIGFLFLISRGDPEKVKTANKVLVFTILGIIVFLIAPSIVAVVSDALSPVAGDIKSCSGAGGANVVSDAILNLINWLAWLIAIVAVLAGLYSGFLYMTASGNAEQVQKATKTFVFAIIGVAISILAFSIISIAELFLK